MEGKVKDGWGREPGVLETFGRITQIHGLHYILTPQYRLIRRILWALAFFLSLLYFLFMTYEIMVRYFNYGTKTTTQEILLQKIDFPTITICSENPLKLTTLSDTGKYSSIKTNYQSIKDWSSAVVASGENLTSVAIAAGPQLADLVISCTIAGAACDSSAWKSSVTEKGQCHTLTSLPSQEISGIRGGLKLVLNTASYDVTYDIGGIPGIQVLLHDSAETPSLLMDEGIDISPGYKANLRLSKSQTLRLPAPYGVCKDSIPGCFQECAQQSLQTSCACVPFDNKGKYTQCSTALQMTCVRNILNNLATKGSTDCDCPPPCDDRKWTASSTSSQLSEIALTNDLTSSTKSSITTAYNKARTAAASTGAPGVPAALHYKETLAYVNVYYPSLMYTQTTSEADYTFMAHVKDHAITLLVFFGASILSFFEIIDVICVAIARCAGCAKPTVHA